MAIGSSISTGPSTESWRTMKLLLRCQSRSAPLGWTQPPLRKPKILGFQRGGWVQPKGRLWLATERGLAEILPFDIGPNVWFFLWDDEVGVGDGRGAEEKCVTRERPEHIETLLVFGKDGECAMKSAWTQSRHYGETSQTCEWRSYSDERCD